MKKKKYRELYKKEENTKPKKNIIKEQTKKVVIKEDNKSNEKNQEDLNDTKVLFSSKGILKEIFKD